jgi:hypothetical protein
MKLVNTGKCSKFGPPEDEPCYYCSQFKPEIQSFAEKVYKLHPYLRRFAKK